MLRKTSLITLLIALLSACAPQATPTTVPVITGPVIVTETPAATAPTEASLTEALTFTDGLDRQITLAGPAQRVVSLAPSNTEILFAIGAGAQVVGRDEFSISCSKPRHWIALAVHW